MLRLSRWDAKIFLAALPRLKVLCKELTKGQRAMVENMLERVRDNYFDIGERNDIGGHIDQLSALIN